MHIKRPLVAVACAWNEIAAENVHLERVSRRVKDGIIAAGATPMEFGSIHGTDVLSEASEGMRYVLPARETIADSVELMVKAHAFDAIVLIAGGDKVTPGMVMGALRCGLPTIYLYAGTTETGKIDGEEISWETVFEGIARVHSGEIDDAQLTRMELAQMPGAGGGASAYTGNTMALCVEAIGLALPGAGSVVAGSAEHLRIAYNTGFEIGRLIENDITIDQIVTAEAIRNAARVALAVCGSTNISLHLPAIAYEAGVEFDWNTFQELAASTPTLVKLRPSGDVSLPQFHRAGGVQALLREIAPLLEESPRIRPVADADKGWTPGVIASLDAPLDATGGLKVLRGSLAPLGAIVKSGGVPANLLRHSGPARVFESEEDAIVAIHGGSINPGDVVIIRNEGPRGGPGFREMLGATAAIVGMGLAETVVLITDGRFSGASHGAAIGYACPEAASGGPIAYVQNGDKISIDVVENRIDIDVDEATLKARTPTPGHERPKRGILARYARYVAEACDGAVLKNPD
jgi:dihydroxy-acid dehydratase